MVVVLEMVVMLVVVGTDVLTVEVLMVVMGIQGENRA